MTPEAPEQPTILISHDTSKAFKTLIPCLKKAGFRIVLTRRGNDILKCLERSTQDLILLDAYTSARISDQLQSQITENHRIAQVLCASEQQYRHLADKMADGVAIIQQGQVVFANTSLEAMLNLPREAILGRKVQDLFQCEAQAEHDRQVQELLTHQIVTFHAQVFCIPREAQERWVEGHHTRIVWEGTPAILVTFRDITDQKHRELAIKTERNHLRQENLSLRATLRDRYKLGRLIGKSPVMQEIYEAIIHAAASEATILISGESGSGKEIVARTIHQMSSRHDQAFVAVNCGAVPEALFENEFFGHRKGAFTGAERDRPGFFDRAHRGTLFLDEIGELTPIMQVKLLRVLEDKEYIPVGDTIEKYVDVRIIAATNMDMKEQLQNGRLRDDFFYRVDVLTIKVPPLRNRREDLPLLIEHFLKQYRHDKECSDIPKYIMEAFCHYEWPGNVRELQNEVQRYLAGQPLEFLEDLHTDADMVSTTLSEANLGLREALEAFEKRVIAEKLAQHHGCTGKVATALRIPLRTLQRKIHKYRLGEK